MSVESNHYECQMCSEDKLIRGFRKDNPTCDTCGSHDLLRLPHQWYNTPRQEKRGETVVVTAIPVSQS